MAKVTIYCSSSSKVSPMFFSEMELLATGLVRAGHEIIYGGAQLGLMGQLAQKSLSLGGRVTGVIPEFLNRREMVQEGLTETIIVNNLLDRKRVMMEMADVLVAFPGGIGTLDEVTEALALRQLDEIKQPVLFLNFLDYWTPFLEYLTLMQQQKMVSQPLDELFSVLETSNEVVEYIGSNF